MAGYAQTAASPPDLKQQVLEILAASCASCHNAQQASGKLRLDTLEGLTAGGASGPAVVPGQSESSNLYQRVTSSDRTLRMPLAGASLAPPKLAALKAWIDAGADGVTRHAAVEKEAPLPVKNHWAYQRPARPALPKVQGKATNPIDNFILAKLEQQRMKFSPEATKETLIRRLSLDLIGLPPSPSEVDEFVNDTRPDAYERVVDRLLASPHYGERWARPWLDFARYADTNGYEADFRRTMWKYRDWVIDALNSDMPFDRFTVEQIAGDMLPKATIEQKIATGFHRNTMYNEEGGVDKDEAYFEVLVDRVSTTASVWLGSTIGCAQCHNHKYDPFSQKEYYQLMAFFTNAVKKAVTSTKYEEAQLDLPTPEQEQQRASLKARIEQIEAKLKTSTPELESDQKDWESKVLRAGADWVVVKPERLVATSGTVLAAQPDGSVVASGANPQRETFVVEGKIKAPLSGIRLEAMTDARLPKGGPGRDVYGNFILTELRVEIQDRSGWQPLVVKRTLVDDGRLKDKRTNQLWTIDASREENRLPRQLVLIPEQPMQNEGETRIRVSLVQNSALVGQAMGRFRLSVSAADDPSWIVKIHPRLRSILETDATQRTGDDVKRLAEFYRTVAPSLEKDRDELKDLKERRDKLGITTALIMQEQAGVDRPFDFIRTRGSFSAKTDKVYANVPAVLGTLSATDPPNRLGLARWLTSKDNPLTARVAVNRIWEQYFGHGIVETSEDFGSQGQLPSHPELLDWLAVEFMERGWSMKAIHRLIVTSTTYRQSSAVTPESLRLDPYNRLISRGPRFRLEAEMIRDVSLSASGLLNRKIGGPSVFPPQPPGVWDQPYNDDSWKESEGEDKYRRGLYTFVRRSAPYPAMTNFDATSREFCTIRRIRTNTPLQALTTLNDPAFFEAAQALGRRIVKEGGASDRERIEYGFRLCVARPAKPAEMEGLLRWQNRERQHSSEEAVWTVLGNILLNLDETLTKE
jgi:hypothetical protein